MLAKTTPKPPLILANAERLIRLGRFAHECRDILPPGRNGATTHIGTFIRWHKDGKLVGGRKVYLECVKYGGLCSSREALIRFISAVTDPSAVTYVDGTTRKNDVSRVERQLAEAGL